MGLFSNLFSNNKYSHIVDVNTFREYLQKELEFSINEHLESSANLYLYLNGSKEHIQIWNYNESMDEEEKGKGIIVYYNEQELTTIDELFNNVLTSLPNYFKIELIDMDSEFLNQYRSSHPELKIEDYN